MTRDDYTYPPMRKTDAPRLTRLVKLTKWSKVEILSQALKLLEKKVQADKLHEVSGP